jgi:hypothetical protein
MKRQSFVLGEVVIHADQVLSPRRWIGRVDGISGQGRACRLTCLIRAEIPGEIIGLWNESCERLARTGERDRIIHERRAGGGVRSGVGERGVGAFWKGHLREGPARVRRTNVVEISGAFCGGRYSLIDGTISAGHFFTTELIGKKEKSLLFALVVDMRDEKRAADGVAKVVLVILRPRDGVAIVEPGISIEGAIAQILEGAACAP